MNDSSQSSAKGASHPRPANRQPSPPSGGASPESMGRSPHWHKVKPESIEAAYRAYLRVIGAIPPGRQR